MGAIEDLVRRGEGDENGRVDKDMVSEGVEIMR